MVEAQFSSLESGATVAFSEYGDPQGAPVFFCHGWPSSRTMAELTHDAARDLGVRIISPDRPGFAIRNSIQTGPLARLAAFAELRWPISRDR